MRICRNHYVWDLICNRKKVEIMNDEKKVISGQLFIDRWIYSKPESKPNKDGKIVVISMKSCGPLEVYEWGIASDRTFYEKYVWCENDLFEDTSYERKISKESFLEQIEKVEELIKDTDLKDWTYVYDEIVHMIG